MSVLRPNEAPSSESHELRLLSSGELFHDRYQVVRCIGAGGMGAVYEVLHRTTQRRRVLKTMLPSLLADADLRDRFRLEATVTAGIESEHLVEVFDAGLDQTTGIPFFVMEYLRGENLANVLHHCGHLPSEDVLTLLQQASLALERTHAAGVVHRDLKPENLFLTHRDDGSPRLKILDFGIAKVIAQSTNLKTTRNFGTPLYMSPEQLRGDGDIDGRADLYSLGHLAFTLLVGSAYWEADAMNVGGVYSLLLKVAEGAKEPASTRAGRCGIALPSGFDAWFARATASSAVNRFESATELVEELSSILKAPASQNRNASKLLLRGHQVPKAHSVEPTQAQPPLLTLGGLSHTDSSSKGNRQPTPSTFRRRMLLVGVGALGGLLLLAGALTQRTQHSITKQAGTSRPEEQSPATAMPSTVIEALPVTDLVLQTAAKASKEKAVEEQRALAPSTVAAPANTGGATLGSVASAPSALQATASPDPSQTVQQSEPATVGADTTVRTKPRSIAGF